LRWVETRFDSSVAAPSVRATVSYTSRIRAPVRSSRRFAIASRPFERRGFVVAWFPLLALVEECPTQRTLSVAGL